MNDNLHQLCCFGCGVRIPGSKAGSIFRCADCGKEEVWTGSQQKWWYEIAKGFVYSSAVRCRACRRKERARRDEARRVHLEGIARKNQARTTKRAERSS